MSFYKMSSEVFNAVKSCEALKNSYVIKAFPYTDKPARLTKNVIAVMPPEIEAKAVSIGEAKQSGSLTVTVQIFAPVKAGIKSISETAENTVNAVMLLNPSGISVSPVKADERLNCLNLSCCFTFDYYSGEED